MAGTVLSRRGWWTVTGGAALAAVSGALVWNAREAAVPAADTAGTPGGYVDHDGWMVTADDKRKLAPAQTQTPAPGHTATPAPEQAEGPR